jgi:hypothetical protein
MKVIGITGRKGSGKDLVAQMLTNRHLVIEGPDRYGDVRQYEESLWDGAKTHVVPGVHAAFADYLKAIFQRFWNVPGEALWGPSILRETTIVEFGALKLPLRKGLQLIGTEFGRAWHEDIWVEYGKLVYELCRERSEPLVVFSDVRFQNEIDWIRGVGGEIWSRGALIASTTDAHASEQLEIVPDRVIPRFDDLGALYQHVAQTAVFVKP